MNAPLGTIPTTHRRVPHPSRSLAKGGIVKSHPYTSHNSTHNGKRIWFNRLVWTALMQSRPVPASRLRFNTLWCIEPNR